MNVVTVGLSSNNRLDIVGIELEFEVDPNRRSHTDRGEREHMTDCTTIKHFQIKTDDAIAEMMMTFFLLSSNQSQVQSSLLRRILHRCTSIFSADQNDDDY